MAAYFSSAKGASFLGGSGGMPPRKFWNLDPWKCNFHSFPDSIWALKTIKIKYVYYSHSFLKISITGFQKRVREVWGPPPPKKILKLRCLEMLFSLFSRQCLGLKTIKILDCINHIHSFPDSIWALRTIKIKYVYYSRSFLKISITGFQKRVRGVWGHPPPQENFEIEMPGNVIFTVFQTVFGP